MEEKLLHSVKFFLKQHLPAGLSRLLLGFSGGPDSLSLLHLILESGLDIELHLAHVDHGWRSESEREALQLEEYASSLQIPFHQLRLEEACHGELEARLARYAFFKSLYEKLQCRALLLGHQADDQSETVLKRVLEGASLAQLQGILPISSYEGMAVWRPMLAHPKKEIYAFLEKRGLTPLEDRTNSDPKYLRTRLRKAILPELSAQFGKEVSSNLRKLALASTELHGYLARRIHPYLQACQERDGIIHLDFTPFYPLESVEVKAFLKEIARLYSFKLSSDALSKIFSLLESGKRHGKVISGSKIVMVQSRDLQIK